MPGLDTAAEALVSQVQTESHASSIAFAAAVVCLVWCTFIAIICSIGYIQLWRHYSRPTPAPISGNEAPHVTIIRPIKGLEPCLYDCLAATFRHEYPRSRLHVRFCISSRGEPSLPVLDRLLRDFPDHDAQILVEDEDVELNSGKIELGPNPKIRNMSRAYREAVGDIVWIIDCNVWVAKGTLSRMVATLTGSGHSTSLKYKFVHQLPLVVDTVGSTTGTNTTQGFSTLSPTARNHWTIGGGRLEEVFMSSSHAKFYTAINTVLLAPCVVGKSTMFRPSHLNSLTRNQGIDFFSENICEDHLIGDLLWKQKVPEELKGELWGKHALCFGDLAVQPMANMSVREYWSRRVRWLRVRKYTVTLATLVEPGTESLLCSLYGAFAITTLPFFNTYLGIPPTWTAFAHTWLLSVALWCTIDWSLYLHLHAFKSTPQDEDTPVFARCSRNGHRRLFGEWLLAWLGRESLALLIWGWAFWGGATVEWRGRKFWVGGDMKVHAIVGGNGESRRSSGDGALQGSTGAGTGLAGKMRGD
ncbi:hypothetical protein LTR08_006161 [Meristemomyces frigidus]|nr:hypothetical protein LTR08_006161 [Meristemomyces frigidus]